MRKKVKILHLKMYPFGDSVRSHHHQYNSRTNLFFHLPEVGPMVDRERGKLNLEIAAVCDARWM